MRCKHVIEQLADYRHGRLGQAEVGAVRSHLAGCPACTRQLRLEQFAGMLLAATREEVEPSPFFATRIQAALAAARGEAARKHGIFVWWEALRQLAPPMVALMLLIFALTFVPQLSENPATPGIEDLAQLTPSGDEGLLLPSEELDYDRVSRTVLPSER